MNEEFAIARLERLIAGCKANDRKAQEGLYHLYYKKMLKIVAFDLKDTHCSQETVNNAFLTIFKKINQYSGEGSFEGWCWRVLHTRKMDSIKKREKYRREISYDSNEPYQYNKQQTPFNKIIHSEQITSSSEKVIWALFDELPIKTAAACRLHVEGFKHREIGQILGITDGTSKWHVSTGMAALREMCKKKKIRYAGI